jgi:subtilisin family serine protease
MKLRLLAVALIGMSLHSFGQHRMCVQFTPKTADQNPYVELSPRALARREAQGLALDDRDRALNADFIKALNAQGKVLSVSRWLNSVVYESELSAQEVRAAFFFVESVREIGMPKMTIPEVEIPQEKSLNYGVGIEQVQQLNLDCLHDQGYTGDGVYVGIIDAGFVNMDSLVYFNNVYQQNRILDRYNFVNDNTDMYIASTHGTAVASCIVGDKQSPDEFAGTAIHVDLALYLSEDVASETEIEEFYVVEALERADSVGVDVVNISLGYFDFDDPQTSHTYSDMDGNTTIAAQGVNVAFTRGIAVVCSAGNSGPGKIGTPCDSDDGLCVGAVTVTGDYAFFSSVGPSADGQVKPDVAARGQDAWVVTPPVPGILQMGNGTSFASPIMAGAVACLRQANPAASVDELFNSIRQSASQFASPDTLLGYGIPDFCAAHQTLGFQTPEVTAELEFEVFPNPASAFLTVDFGADQSVKHLRVVNLAGQEMFSLDSALSTLEIPLHALGDGMYFLRVQSPQGQGVQKFEVRK